MLVSLCSGMLLPAPTISVYYCHKINMYVCIILLLLCVSLSPPRPPLSLSPCATFYPSLPLCLSLPLFVCISLLRHRLVQEPLLLTAQTSVSLHENSMLTHTEISRSATLLQGSATHEQLSWHWVRHHTCKPPTWLALHW